MYPGAPGGYATLPGQPYPGQPYPGQPYPQQPYPPQPYPSAPAGPVPYYPGPAFPPSGPHVPPGMPPVFPGFLPPHLSAFAQHYDADETWGGNPGSVQKELGLIEQRKNDMYPQGRDNCMKFLRECQSRGLNFKIKAKKTKPYWTWYYEVDGGAAPAPAPGHHGFPGFPGFLPPHLSAFAQHYDADQTWECKPGDVPKEMGLIDQRKNDMYPQGRDNCLNFLRECQSRGLSFKVKAKKTKPYWTWYYEANQPARPSPANFFNMLPPHMAPFFQHYDADQTWDGNPSDVPKEMGLIEQRKNDMYPQGRDNCMNFLRECQSRGYRFKIKAKKTKPYWTWYYEVVA